MLAFLAALRRGRGLATQLPGLVIALSVAEFFYKFSSFTLECVAFLATWLAVDVIVHALWPAAPAARRHAGDAPGGA
jgi:hypothetical protein